MRKRSIRLLMATLFVLLLPGLAWALAQANVTVMADGKPLQNAEVTLFTPDGQSDVKKTDAQGRAPFTVDLKGKTEGTATIQVQKSGHRTGTQQISLKDGQTTDVPFALAGFPLNTQNPGGGWNFRVGPMGLFQEGDLKRSKEIENLFVNGALAASLANASPDAFEMRLRSGGVDAALSFPGFTMVGWTFSPAVSGALGAADLKITNATSDIKFTGTGLLAGANAELSASPASLPRLYLAAGWQGWWVNVDDLDVRIGERALCSQLFPTAQSCRTRADLSGSTNEGYVKAGFTLFDNHLGFFGGAKYRTSDWKLEQRTDAVISGFNVQDTLDLDLRRGRCGCFLGIAGFDVRGPTSVPLLRNTFGRVQADFNGSGVDVMFKVMFGWRD